MDFNFVKIEDVEAEDEIGVSEDGYLRITIDEGQLTGTWTLTGYNANFYTVKGANGYAIYYVNPDASTGDWTTAHLRNPGGNPSISHLQVSTTPVPEPGTLLLFGTGLAGLAAVGRRRKN